MIVAATLLLVACGGDDDGGALVNPDTTPSTPVPAADQGSSQPADSGDSGYTEGFQASFMSGCQANGASEDQCECILNEFIANVPYEEYVAVDEALRSGEMSVDEAPEWLTGTREACGIGG